MIPQFPQFKPLELSDKKDIEAYTAQFPPYSDFNFVSMWSWNIKDEIRISDLHGNLVVRFTDYLTGEPFYSFLGCTKVVESIHTLLELSRTENLAVQLSLIPEICIEQLPPNSFTVTEQPEHFDYVLSVERLLPHDGSERKLSTRRKILKKFKETTNVDFKAVSLEDPEVQQKIYNVFLQWEHQLDPRDHSSEHLKIALQRLFLMRDFSTVRSFGAFVDGQLIGYSINEHCNDGYVIGHFQHGNIDIFDGIYGLLMHEVAPALHSAGSIYINVEQDLGLPGLKKWKSSHNPNHFLKKYSIRPVV